MVATFGESSAALTLVCGSADVSMRWANDNSFDGRRASNPSVCGVFAEPASLKLRASLPNLAAFLCRRMLMECADICSPDSGFELFIGRGVHERRPCWRRMTTKKGIVLPRTPLGKSANASQDVALIRGARRWFNPKRQICLSECQSEVLDF